MKLLLSLLAIMLLTKDCDQKKSEETTTTVNNTEKMSDATQEIIQVWYEATTRGYYEKIWVTKDSLKTTNDRDHKVSLSHPTSEKDWKELMHLLKDVNVSAMPELEAPTKLRLHDGAATASLGVSQNKKQVVSNGFDHGHPPKAIEAVVNKVLSMKEKHEKN